MARYRQVEQLLTIKEAAERLRCSVKTIRRRIKSGLLPMVRHGHHIMIDPRDLAQFVDSVRFVKA